MDVLKIRMSHTECAVSDVTGTKCAEVLFSGNCLCRHGLHMFDRCFGSAASHPSTPPPPPHSQDSAADARQKKKKKKKSCIVSPAFVKTWPEFNSQYRHVKLNHCTVLISLWEQQPQGMDSECVACYLSVLMILL